MGKQACGATNVNLASCMVCFNQFCVAVKGGWGADVLHHARVTIEGLAATWAMGPAALIDIDLLNRSPSIERRAITQAYHEELTSTEALDV